MEESYDMSDDDVYSTYDSEDASSATKKSLAKLINFILFFSLLFFI